MNPVFGLAQIEQAATRLQGLVVQTPLLNSPMLDAQLGCRLFLKAENLQRTGSFKLRGALNKVLGMDAAVRAKGLVAFSSGNHGQGVAAAAHHARCPAVVVMPKTAPRIKVENCQWWGAEVVLYDPDREDRTALAQAIAGPRGMQVVPPFDDLDIMAGQGSCGLEIAAQLQQLQLAPDLLLTGCSGGGLASGTGMALRAHFPDLAIHVAEPEGFEKMARSLRTGTQQRNATRAPTLMDAIAGPVAGSLPLQVLLRLGASGVGVSDQQALRAMATAFRHFKIVLEPGGVAALAAVLAGTLDCRGKNVVVVASGGNVDPAVFEQALRA